jgi:hypothetical protein
MKILLWLYYWRFYCDFIIEDPIGTLLLKNLLWLYFWRPYCDFITEDPIVTLLLNTLWWLYYWRPYCDYYWRPYSAFIIEDHIMTLLLKNLLWPYFWRHYCDFIIEDAMVTIKNQKYNTPPVKQINHMLHAQFHSLNLCIDYEKLYLVFHSSWQKDNNKPV